MKQIAFLSATISLSLLTGCASIVNGTHQKISVLTSPVNDAKCALKNNKGEWSVNSTPASIIVQRSDKDLVITCNKQGYAKSTTQIQSKTTSAVYGNLLLGGGIGAVIDKSNGSAYEYPPKIKIPLKPIKK